MNRPIGTKTLTARQRQLIGMLEVRSNVAVFTGPPIPDWKVLKAVMVALGGKWKTSTGFAFPEDVDAVELVRLAHESGEILDPREAEFFETSEDLADELAGWVRPRQGGSYLEPSAGRGALVKALRRLRDDTFVSVFEPLPEHRRDLETMRCTFLGEDFLQAKPMPVFDGVLMNPPFSKRQDVKHITHALGFLKPDCRLAAIAAAGVLYRDDKVGTAFRQLVAQNSGTIEKNPPKSFAHAGTNVETVTIRLVKGGA